MQKKKNSVSCEQRKVKEAYHVICTDCAKQKMSCVKCQQPRKAHESEPGLGGGERALGEDDEREDDDGSDGDGSSGSGSETPPEDAPINATEEALAQRNMNQRLDAMLKLIPERRRRTVMRRLRAESISVRRALELAAAFLREREAKRGFDSDSDSGSEDEQKEEEEEDNVEEEIMVGKLRI
jgi:hypothetical protein